MVELFDLETFNDVIQAGGMVRVVVGKDHTIEVVDPDATQCRGNQSLSRVDTRTRQPPTVNQLINFTF